MHVILRYLHRINLYVVVRCDLAEDLSDSLLDIASQDPFAVLRGPHKMVLRVVDRMAGPSCPHGRTLLHDTIRRNSAIIADSSLA